MNDDERHLVGAFLYGQTLLNIDDTGLTEDNQLDDLVTVATLCLKVKAITAAGDTLEQLCLHRLATLTEEVLFTGAVRSRQAVKQWLIARAELLELKLATH
ncbi:MAG: hypothetical protein JOZ23_04610 [Mycobacterium sp.]|nr:hypothetical protein [Mycobacterium sp.]